MALGSFVLGSCSHTHPLAQPETPSLKEPGTKGAERSYRISLIMEISLISVLRDFAEAKRYEISGEGE